MRIHSILLVIVLCGLAAGAQTYLSPRFQTVFILSMANSFDQYLASRLTSGRVLWVVLQPSNADAVLTETLDEDFWNWLEKTYPAPAGTTAPNGGEGAYRNGYPPSVKHRGTIFLIDPRKRVVLWSTYELPRSSTPGELDRSAVRITSQLRGAFGKK